MKSVRIAIGIALAWGAAWGAAAALGLSPQPALLLAVIVAIVAVAVACASAAEMATPLSRSATWSAPATPDRAASAQPRDSQIRRLGATIRDAAADDPNAAYRLNTTITQLSAIHPDVPVPRNPRDLAELSAYLDQIGSPTISSAHSTKSNLFEKGPT